MAGINPKAASGGRISRPLLDSNGADFDGITSTTDTNYQSESVYIPECYQATFIIDVDAATAANVVARVQYTLDGGTNWNGYYWDRASATASTVNLTATGYSTLRVVNPFPCSADGNIRWRVQFEPDGDNADIAMGDCYLMMGPVPYANPRFSQKQVGGFTRQ
jgi:hypothetical protein